MILIFAWSGLVLTVIGLLNLLFFTVVPPLMSVPQSVGCIVLGVVMMFIGRQRLPALLTYLFSGDGGDSHDD